MEQDGGLTQDFDAHVFFTFVQIPDKPWLENRKARVGRWFTIAFAESWLAVWLYRAKMRLRDAKVPLLPESVDIAARALFRVQIGNQVHIGPGLMITHGHVVIDGATTIGLTNSKKVGFSLDGPTIGDDVYIGTGAKIIGPVTVGDGARIGANAVVIHDVPAGATVVGVPARVVVPKPAAAAPAIKAMREAIAQYRLKQVSLRVMVDELVRSLERHPEALDGAHPRAREDLIFLDAVAATGGDETRQVEKAIDSIDTAIEAP